MKGQVLDMDTAIVPTPVPASGGGSDNALLYVLALAVGGVAAYWLYDWSQSKPKPKTEDKPVVPEVVSAPVAQQPRGSAAPAAPAAPAVVPPAVAPKPVQSPAAKAAELAKTAYQTAMEAKSALPATFRPDWDQDALEIKQKEAALKRKVAKGEL